MLFIPSIIISFALRSSEFLLDILSPQYLHLACR